MASTGVMPATVPYNTDTGVGIYIREKGVRGEFYQRPCLETNFDVCR